jgi:hypothetical protein
MMVSIPGRRAQHVTRTWMPAGSGPPAAGIRVWTPTLAAEVWAQASDAGDDFRNMMATRLRLGPKRRYKAEQRVAPTCFSVMKGFKMTYKLNFFLLQI